MKSRRLISFLSLFSLVLILSIYYVLVPVNNVTLENGIEDDNSSEVGVISGEDAYFENLEITKVNKFNDDIDDLNLIVASSGASIEEKIEALEMIAQKKKLNKEEQLLKDAIKEAGYSNAFVEYENDTVNILVSKKDATKGDAVIIIRLAYEKLGNSYIPSVSFKA
jgi:uncharacterized protein YbjQ (UPF0145 family)